MPSDAETLAEMGFPMNQAQRALAKTGYKGVQLAMDWLFAHADDPDINEPFEEPKGHVIGEASADSKEGPSQEDGAQSVEEGKSFKCDDCGKVLKSEMDVQAHAARTQHSNFSESTEEIKPLTEEERKAQLAAVQERLKEKRLEKQEQEKKEAIQREKMRRNVGRDMGLAKQKMEEAEMKKIAEERRREKLEEKQARQRVKDQIEKDKKDRAEKFSKEKQSAEASPASSQAQISPPPVAQPKEYTDCRLQIRLTNGSTLTQTFAAKEPLSAVRLYVDMNRTDGNTPFAFMTTFPRKVFSLSDMEVPLDALGLVPSSVLILTKPQ